MDGGDAHCHCGDARRDHARESGGVSPQVAQAVFRHATALEAAAVGLVRNKP